MKAAMKPHVWTAADEQYLQEHYAEAPLSQLCERLQCTVKAVRSRAKLLKLKRSGRKPWTADEEVYVRAQYDAIPTKQIAKHLGRTLGTVYQKAAKLGCFKSQEYLHNPANRCRLQKGSNIGSAFRFPEGHKPANKGVKMPGWAPGGMAETQFKKGERTGIAAENWCPIGTIRPDADGYLRIKVREAVYGQEPTGWGNSRVWPQVHRRIWEAANGPIPPKHIVVFKDHDKNNCDLENLECISLTENMRRNTVWNQMPKELAELVQLKGAINRQINRRNNAQTHE